MHAWRERRMTCAGCRRTRGGFLHQELHTAVGNGGHAGIFTCPRALIFPLSKQPCCQPLILMILYHGQASNAARTHVHNTTSCTITHISKASIHAKRLPAVMWVHDRTLSLQASRYEESYITLRNWCMNLLDDIKCEISELLYPWVPGADSPFLHIFFRCKDALTNIFLFFWCDSESLCIAFLSLCPSSTSLKPRLCFRTRGKQLTKACDPLWMHGFLILFCRELCVYACANMFECQLMCLLVDPDKTWLWFGLCVCICMCIHLCI